MSDAPRTDPSATLRRIRWAQATAFGLVGLALVATAAQSLLGARRSYETLTIGQGRRLLAAVQGAHHSYGYEIGAHLEEVLKRNQEFGLRCIALFRPDRMRTAGDCLLSHEQMRNMLTNRVPDRPVSIGDHVAMIDDPSRGPGLPGGGPLGGRRRDGRRLPPPEGRDGLHRRGPPPLGGPGGLAILPPVLIEFEPIEAEGLRASVTGGVVVALVALVVLVGGAFALFRLTRRAEHLQREAERDRRLVTLGEMASVLAHEIRNPLAALKGNAQLLAEQLPDDGREKRGAERVVRSAVRLESLTEDLLSFVRSNRVERGDVSPAELVRDSLAQVGTGDFEVDTSGAPARWRLDPNRMQQVLVNLFRNAAEASPEGRAVEIEVFERDRKLVLRVRDFGAGIPAGQEERIFEPFVTERTRGTGLGLAVARRIAELHGGSIAARNHAAGGAEFEVVIP